MIALIVSAAVAGIIALWLIAGYNGFVTLRNQKDEAWSGVDVQLKRRHDLVGNLVNAVKGYMAHEKEIMEEIARARAACMSAKTVGDAAQSQNMLTQALGRLFAVAENYPQLRAADNVMQLQQSLADLEDDIQHARRYYNGTVREYNTRLQQFPSNLIGKMFGFVVAEFFEITDPKEREAPVVQF